MNYYFLFAIMMIESSGNVCVTHKNPVIHGALGMSEIALKEIGLTVESVKCSKVGSYAAAWKNQLRWWKYSGGDPWKMAIIHHQGIGGFLKGRYDDVYMGRFAKHYNNLREKNQCP